MSKSEAQAIEKGDIVLTASGRKATVVYLHTRDDRVLIKYDGNERSSVSRGELVKLPESERSKHSAAARRHWATKKAFERG